MMILSVDLMLSSMIKILVVLKDRIVKDGERIQTERCMPCALATQLTNSHRLRLGITTYAATCTAADSDFTSWTCSRFGC